MMNLNDELKQIRKHFVHVDYYEYLLGYYFSSWFILLVKDSRVTPNKLTLVSIFLNICAAVVFAQGDYLFLIAGAVLVQAAFIIDFADGQLARYKEITSGFGKWMDIMGDVLSDCLVYAGLAYGVYSNTHNHNFGYLVIFTCALMPFYCLHRQVRNSLMSTDENLTTSSGEKVNRSLSAIKLLPIHKKLVISLGAVMALPEMTLIAVAVIVFGKFCGSVVLFILHHRRSNNAICLNDPIDTAIDNRLH